MASLVYTKAKANLLSADIDLNADDIRVVLVMTDSTADTEEDTTFMDQFSTLDEMDGAGYSRQAIANEAVNIDNANDRGEFDGDDITFSGVSAGTRNVLGMIVYKHVTNDADSIPIAYIDTGGFPITPNGGDITISWNVEGILQLS